MLNIQERSSFIRIIHVDDDYNNRVVNRGNGMWIYSDTLGI